MPRKVALVTGGGTGVGAATVLRLSAAGFDVALLYRSSAEAAHEVARAAEVNGARVLEVRCDVTIDAECRAAVARVDEELRRLDLVVNCAGATKLVAFDDLDGATDEIFQDLLSSNVLGAMHIVRAARSLLARTAAANAAEGLSQTAASTCVINISSTAARLVQGSSLPYACSKAALDALTIGLARTLAPANVRVNGIAPGFIEGDWLRILLGDNFEAQRDAFAHATPLRRVCRPDDVAEAVVNLSHCAMITGQTLVVDGGSVIKGFVTSLPSIGGLATTKQ